MAGGEFRLAAVRPGKVTLLAKSARGGERAELALNAPLIGDVDRGGMAEDLRQPRNARIGIDLGKRAGDAGHA